MISVPIIILYPVHSTGSIAVPDVICFNLTADSIAAPVDNSGLFPGRKQSTFTHRVFPHRDQIRNGKWLPLYTQGWKVTDVSNGTILIAGGRNKENFD